MVSTEVRPADVGQWPPRPGLRAMLLRHWRLTVGFILAVVLVVAGAVGYRWRNGLQLFGAADGGMLGARIAIASPYYADVNFSVTGHAATVDVRSVSPDIISNTAAADYQVMTCHKNQENVLGASAAPQGCADRPAPLHAGGYKVGDHPGDVTFLIRFTARSGGVFEFHGVNVSYDVGWRHGSQRTGIDQQYRTP
jgi:hypothetical protein